MSLTSITDMYSYIFVPKCTCRSLQRLFVYTCTLQGIIFMLRAHMEFFSSANTVFLVFHTTLIKGSLCIIREELYFQHLSSAFNLQDCTLKLLLQSI